jgi:hypothetical protein
MNASFDVRVHLFLFVISFVLNLKQFEEIRQFRRQSGDEIQSFTGFRMRKRQFFGVQKKAIQITNRLPDFEIGDGFIASGVISFVADDRVIDVRAVDANLVRSAGFDFDAEQGKFLESFFHFPQGHGIATVRADAHFRAVVFFPGNRRVNRSGVRFQLAVNERDVGFENAAGAKLLAQSFENFLIFGDDDQAGSVFVEPVNDADAISRFGFLVFG